jgi:hypothetical protein
MKLSQIAYIHVYELLEFFQFFMETLNFWSKFGSENSNRLISQTTERNGMKLSQIKYIHVLELLELFKIFLETLNFRTKIVSQF